MAHVKVGVLVDSLGLPVREGLARASSLGFRSVQLAPRGAVDPRELSRTGRRHLAKYLSELGLSLAGWFGDPGGRRLADSARVEQHIERGKAALELAAETGAPVVTLPTGGLPSDPDDATARQIIAAVRELSDHADRVGALLALETGGEPPARLAELLRRLDNRALRVSYDPAGLLLSGLDPVAGVGELADHIVAVRSRDAVAAPGSSEGGAEVALGRGQLDYRAVLGALAEAGYYGVHTLTRSRSDSPAADLAEGRRFLEGL